MQLVSFSVSNYRSITTAKKVPLSTYSLLVGANNEGKSNILHALALAMDVLVRFKYQVRRGASGQLIRVSRSATGSRVGYDWSSDFPISKQEAISKIKQTKITLEFQLDEAQTQEFKAEIKSNLNGTLPITLSFHQDGYDIAITKQGPGGKTLTKKANRIAEFVSKRIRFEYIPAIRTANSASRVISELVQSELSQLDDDPEFSNAIAKIKELQEPILKEIGDGIYNTVKKFLPSVNSVELSLDRDYRSGFIGRDLNIFLDDGSRTTLERKGDGVQSLVALALMRHVSEQAEEGERAIIAIEEPEAHLHPAAIHELKVVIQDLAKQNQVVLSSHSPLFINPSNLDSTIIVKSSTAKCATSISEVRNALGVKFSDNLQSARLVAIVEGTDDEIALKAILAKEYPEIAKAIKNGELVFDELGGAANLSYKVRLYHSSACMVQCLLDDDIAGRSAVNNATQSSILKQVDYNLFKVLGKSEAELEDAYNPIVYKEGFLSEFGVDPTIKLKSNGFSKSKWSDRMGAIFSMSGKNWGEPEKSHAKLWLAKFAAETGPSILYQERRGPLDAFASTIISKLNN